MILFHVRGRGFVIAICESCGSPSEPGALFCAHCGTPLKAAATEHLPASSTVANDAAPAIAAVGATPANDGNAFTWPFAQKNWFLSLWILLIGWIPLMTVSIGWMIEAIGRRGRGEADLLPHARNVLRMLSHGILYWVMFALYLAVPIWLLGAILTAETAIITQEFNHWATASIENSAITAANVVLGLGSWIRLRSSHSKTSYRSSSTGRQCIPRASITLEIWRRTCTRTHSHPGGSTAADSICLRAADGARPIRAA